MDDYKELNEILVRLFRSIMDVEEKAIITREFQDITNNDMHVIEAIGIGHITLGLFSAVTFVT